jgi:uncharacterized protein YrrD
MLDAALDIVIGGAVICREGHTGHVRKVVAETSSNRVTGLIVDHGIRRRRVIVPMRYVERIDGATMHLNITGEQLASLRAYDDIEISQPDPTWAARHGVSGGTRETDHRSCAPYGVPLATAPSGVYIRRCIHSGISDEQIPVGHGTRVSCTDGQIGHVDHVLIDPESETILAFAVHRGRRGARDVLVPASAVSWMHEQEIRVSADRSALSNWQDAEPAAAVGRASSE